MKVSVEVSDKLLNRILSIFVDKKTGKKRCTIDGVGRARVQKYLDTAVQRSFDQGRSEDERFDVGLHNLVPTKTFTFEE